MAKSTKSKKEKDQIEDESGADQRLARILKRALNTPPTHKQSGQSKRTGKARSQGTKS